MNKRQLRVEFRDDLKELHIVSDEGEVVGFVPVIKVSYVTEIFERPKISLEIQYPNYVDKSLDAMCL